MGGGWGAGEACYEGQRVITTHRQEWGDRVKKWHEKLRSLFLDGKGVPHVEEENTSKGISPGNQDSWS